MKQFLISNFLFLISYFTFAHPGIGIVKDSRGYIYYTDLKYVWKVSPDGKKEIVVRNVHTHELYMDPQDNLYGEHLWYNGERLDTWGHYVWCLKNTGELVNEIESTEGFLSNYSFVRDTSGNMYWMERFTVSRFKKKSPDGQICTLAEAKLKDVRWMYVTPDGILYFIDLTDLYKIDKQGKFILLAKNLQERNSVLDYASLQHNIYGIWTDKEQNIYVAILGGHVIKKITSDGKVSKILYSKGTWSPLNGLFDDKGDLWLMEVNILNEVRVRKVLKEKLGLLPSAFILFLDKAKPLLIIAGILILLSWLIFLIIRKTIRRIRLSRRTVAL